MLDLWATAHNCAPMRVIKPQMLEGCRAVYEAPGGEYMCTEGLCSRCIVSACLRCNTRVLKWNKTSQPYSVGNLNWGWGPNSGYLVVTELNHT